MSDRKGKPVTPIKKLTKKEREELKKNVSSSGSSQCWIHNGTFNIVRFFCIEMCKSNSDQQCSHFLMCHFLGGKRSSRGL